MGLLGEGYGYGGKKLARRLHSQILHPLGLSAIVPPYMMEYNLPSAKVVSPEKSGERH